MKKIAFAALTMIALLALIVSGCGAPAPPPEPTTPPPPADTPTTAPEATPIPEPVVGTTYKIGFAPSVTGGGSFLGQPERNVAELILEALEEAGGVVGPDGVIHPVEIIMGDTESNPDVAASLARRYIDEDEVVALVMGSLTPISMAISAVAMEAEVPYVSMASAGVIVKNPDTGEVYYWVFKSPQGNFEVGQWQVERLNAMEDVASVCYMYENTGYGGDCYNNSSKLLTEAGFENVFEGAFERTDTEFPQVPGIEAAGCDVVVIGAIPPGASNAHAAIRAALPDIPIIHGHGVCVQDFIEVGGEPIEGAELPCSAVIIAEDVPADDPQKEVFMDFKTAYEEYTGQPVSTFGGHAWDALYWVVEALESLDEGMTLEEQRVAVRDYIETEITDWPGTAGVFNISTEDHCGIDYTSFTWFKVEDQGFVPFPAEEW